MFHRASQILKMFVSGGAWLFALGSLAQVLGYFALSWFVPESERYCQVWAAHLDGQLYEPVGLTYRGLNGQILAAGEAAIVLAGLVFSCLTHPTLRWIGHGGLIAWAAIWVANAFWFLSLAPTGLHGMRAAIIAVLFVCTVLRAYPHAVMHTNQAAGIQEYAA